MTTAYSYIRFSTKKQAAGDSERRQERAFEQACLLHNWTEGDALLDAGLSAYTGANVADGSALRKWIDALHAGAVPRGSVLVVEYLDRLTRLPVVEGVSLFLEIINAGGSIYVANLLKLWSADTINSGLSSIEQISQEIRISFTASQRTQERILAAYAAKRAEAKLKIAAGETFHVGSRTPFWLEVAKDGSFIEVAEQVMIVRRVFDLYLDGYGSTRIAKILNSEGLLRFNGRPWTDWMVSHLIKSPNVCGILEHYDRIGGVLADYYPVVIDYAVFEQVLVILDSKSGKAGSGGGRKPKSVKCFNLFSGLLRCGDCGSQFRIFTDLDPKYNRLGCRLTKSSTCKLPKVRYSDFEDGVLDFLFSKFDLNKIVVGTETKEPADEIKLLKFRIGKLQVEETSLMAYFTSGKVVPKVVGSRLSQIELEVAQLEAELVNASSMIEKPNHWVNASSGYWKFVEMLNKGKDEDLLSIRMRLAQYLKLVVKELVVRNQEEDLRCVEVVADGWSELIKIPSSPCRIVVHKLMK
ncbi:recombinase family protein [Sphaerotilus montanus]|uniref:recombinase family protein n=1 Tax=Sphaerotilus montanus TaxID=522889 RepID=UPI0015D8933E|nr:recombinase family protein [Sphaerotilus montanus]NZD57587.1 recombinase family protein [Sphaerotilus montanus]